MTTFTDMRIESGASYARAANRSIHTFAYRDLGPRDGVPVVLLNHWGAVLDNFDPRIVDGLASRHRVIATDYRGIGASGGTAPITIDEMARDTIALIRTLGFEQAAPRPVHSCASCRRSRPGAGSPPRTWAAFASLC